MTKEYQEALETIRKATRAFAVVQEDYRARRIGDDAFLAAKHEYDTADDVFESVYAKLQESS